MLLAALGALVSTAQSATLAWNPSPNPQVTGYVLYYGTASRSYDRTVNVGQVTNAPVTGLVGGRTYFFAVTATDTLGYESDFSNEISYTVPLASIPTLTLTAPASGASYTAPATVTLAASVTPSGQTIRKVQFFNGPLWLGEQTTPPYFLVWSNVGVGSYKLSAQAIGEPAGSVVVSPTVLLVVTELPAPWRTADVGAMGVVGSASLSEGVCTVTGAGYLGGTADGFRFVYQPMSGDGEIKVRLNSARDAGPDARLGVMIRENLTSDSAYAFIGLSPDGTVRWQSRSSPGGSSATSIWTTGSPADAWVRLVRAGDTFRGESSPDGVTATYGVSHGIGMASTLYVGLVVASGSANTLTTATFDGLTVVP